MTTSSLALSIRQPWAELIMSGRKDVEVRTWSDLYRGPLWIHTGAKVDEIAAKRFRLGPLFTGGVIGLAELVDIRPMDAALFAAWRPRHLDLSQFSNGRVLYGWVFEHVRRLAEPRACKGALGIFELNEGAVSVEELRRLATTS